MQQVFLNQIANDAIFTIDGDDAHHLIKVVRIRVGEKIRVSTPEENYICQVSLVEKDYLEAKVLSIVPSTELPNKIYLFQAIPKGDRMETIIEKCVELGVYEIIPVQMANCIVKLDEKKKKNKLDRYQSIASAAAKQSKRSIIPSIHDVMSFKEAVEYANSLDMNILPYESKDGMADTYKALTKIKKGMSVGVFIGPEGGFSDGEIESVKDKMDIVSLGKRILRTDTAAICSLSMLMLKIEEF